MMEVRGRMKEGSLRVELLRNCSRWATAGRNRRKEKTARVRKARTDEEK
jgi:hypothetical protein